MRLDLVITEMFVGGAERCLTELAVGMKLRGADVRVFSIGSLPTGERAGLVERILNADITIESAESDGVASVVTAMRRLKRWLKSSDADVCQTFLFHGNVLGSFAARSAGVPVVVGGLRVADPSRWRAAIERIAVSRMDALVCVSEATRQFADQHLCHDTNRLVTIGNGVDVARFDAAVPVDWSNIGWPSDANVAIFVGRLHPQKGLDLLQRQADRVLTDPTARLLLIGDGPLRGDIQKWADRTAGDRVKLLPWQSDVAPWMKASRLLVLPSRYEGMPNVVLEAMAAGKPVVCSDVEGSLELLRHNREPQVFTSGDDMAMAVLMTRLMTDNSLADSLGRENHQRVLADFSIDAMVDQYAALYESLLGTSVSHR